MASREPQRKIIYGISWNAVTPLVAIEMEMCRRGGTIKLRDGSVGGNGLLWHWLAVKKLLWPEYLHHRWNELETKCYLENTYIGEMGCIHRGTRILNPITGEQPTVEFLHRNRIAPMVMTLDGPRQAGVPFIRGVDRLYEITTKSGRRFISTIDHLVMMSDESFEYVGNLSCGAMLLGYEPFPHRSILDIYPSVHTSNDLHLIGTTQDSRSDYQFDSCFYDAPPHFWRETSPGVAPSQVGAPGYIHHQQPMGAMGCGSSDSLSSFSSLSNFDSKAQITSLEISEFLHWLEGISLRGNLWSLPLLQSPRAKIPVGSFSIPDHGSVHRLTSDGFEHLLESEIQELAFGQFLSASQFAAWASRHCKGLSPADDSWSKRSQRDSLLKRMVVPDEVVNIKFIGTDVYFDLEVPVQNHYFAEGCIHHNCAAAGKTETASTNILLDWYLYPWCTTCLISSTDLKSLDLRAWGQVKKYHRMAKERFPYIVPGHLIEGTRVIINDAREQFTEGRDFKNGLLAVPTKHGNTYVGLGPLIGIHNKRIRMLADELNLMPRAFLDSTANLSKCEDFRMVGIGQPADTTCAHGDLCEPHGSLGGWDSGIDQTDKTKTWRTKWPNGICVQLPGSDSPNFDVPEGQPPPFPFLITRQQMADDAEHWGTNDWHFTMMNLGRMPRGVGTNRVLTRQLCEKFHAFDQPIWRDSNVKKIAFMDAAYTAGGDRCVFGEMNFGRSAEFVANEVASISLAGQDPPLSSSRQLIHLVDTMVVPILDEKGSGLPEDQIVNFVVAQCERRGISLDDFFYDPGLRTKLTVAFSRITGKTGNPIDCGGKATERPVAIGIDMTCEEYYSKFVTELWYSVRLCVEADQFRGMTKDVAWEFSAREWKKVGANKIEVESKADMKKKTGKSPDCFVAGTAVATPNGNCPIELLRVGDHVVTPMGVTEIVAIHEQEVNEIVKVGFEDGTSLCGKGSHRVFCWDSGWVRMDALSIDNEVESIQNLDLWESANALFTKATPTGFKALVNTFRTGTRMRPSDFYTGPFGENIMDRFLKVLKSTTKMMIGGITTFGTWNCAKKDLTPGITPCVECEMIPSLPNDGGLRVLLPLQNGTALQMVGNGTPSMARKAGSEENPNPYRAACVEHSSTVLGMMPNIAPIPAPTEHPEREIEFSGFAKYAVKASRFLSTKPKSIAPGCVVRIPQPSKRKVYNLTLAEHNVYYANGILVENCADAVAIGLEGARQRGFVIVKAGVRVGKQQSEAWKSRLRLNAGKVWHSADLDYLA